MSQLRIYRDGKPDWLDEGESRARVAGHGGVSLGHFSGTIVIAKRSPEPYRKRDRKAERERTGRTL